jgi:hypothetical protein
MTYATCPDGHELTGTLERLSAVALAVPNITDNDIKPEWDGYTEVDWDSSMTVKSPEGFDIWICADGDQWPADQLAINEDDEDGDDE